MIANQKSHASLQDAAKRLFGECLRSSPRFPAVLPRQNGTTEDGAEAAPAVGHRHRPAMPISSEPTIQAPATA